MNKFVLRNASVSDIPFLIDTIIEAEKSGTDILTYSTIFGLSEEETKEYLAKMLAEEVDGCELSISSFLLAESGAQVVAAAAAWIEGVDGMPSTIIKGNLLNYTLPIKALEKALYLNSIVSDLHIAYIPNTIQIGLLYVSSAFRGQNLASLLIEEQIKSLLKKNTAPTGIYVQVFSNNLAAIKTYDKANFKIVLTKESTHKEILDYMPSKSKVLMKRDL
jgi:ribosomal protein S18 acetylase RimI-like enzyme